MWRMETSSISMKLPLELYDSVFEFLPLTTLLPYRVVCKDWCCVIDSLLSRIRNDNEVLDIFVHNYNPPNSSSSAFTAHTIERINTYNGDYLLFGNIMTSFDWSYLINWNSNDSINVTSWFLRHCDHSGAMAWAVDSNGEYYCFGSYRPGQRACSSLFFQLSEDRELFSVGTMPHDIPICYCGATGTDSNNILVSGGSSTPFQGAVVLNSSYIYNTALNRWTDAAPMLEYRCGHSLITLSNRYQAIALGGYNNVGDYVSSVEQYDAATNHWFVLPSMHYSRSAAATGYSWNQSIYVGGGSYDGSHSVAVTERFDPREGKWELLTTMLTARGYSASCMNGQGNLVVTGGYHDEMIVGSSEMFDARKNQWIPIWERLTVDEMVSNPFLRQGHSLLYLY